MRFSSFAPPRRAVLSLAGLTVALVGGGCDTDVQVAMDVAADGRGRVVATVTLDRAAAQRVGDLRSQLRVDDLVDAGWEIDGPRRAPGGGLVVAAERTFEGPQGAARAVEQLSGDDGPFRDFRIERDSTALRTRTRFSGRVDLEAGLDAFGDDDLQERLGAPLGADAEALRRQLGAAASDAFGFEVVVRLPGRVDSNAPGDAANGAVWRPKLGEDVTLSARAEQWNAASIGFGGLAVVTGLAGLVVLLRSRRRERRHRRRGARSSPTAG